AEIAEEIATRHTNSTYLPGRHLGTSLRATHAFGEAMRGADTIIVAVPSEGVRAVLDGTSGAIEPEATILSVVKGLERGSDQRMSEVIAQCWPGHSVGVLTGPNLAVEILDGQPSASVVAFDDPALSHRMQVLLSSDRLRVYTNPDVVGCEIAGVVKNVLAIAVGLAVGLGFGDNTRAALITRSLAELTRIGVALGGDTRTFAGLAGLGDLVATCTSERSRNFRLGLELGRGRSIVEAVGGSRMIAEGFGSSIPTLDLARRLGVDAPIVEQVVAVCHQGRAPAETIAQLMGRTARPEFDQFEPQDD
ncbi:MAG TPA: NAD(P)H-dependent glycerol-3-phosphate dehydrogenase, partial [Acidimicrobiales bacterium]|nr:NAD(P)H-dependent glycerol-3-phosphate dehydrogenase [Acidimicrobiales bacterium]